MTEKTDTAALVIAEELNEWARDYAPTELATALATCAAVLLKKQNARIAELEALQAAPPAPAAVAVPASQDQYLCQAWGETDLPAVAIVDGLDGVRAFLIEQWLSDEDAAHDDGTKPLLAAMQEMQDEWAEEGEAWKWEIAFEIGGVSVQKVGRAALAAAPAQAVAVPADALELAAEAVFEADKRMCLSGPTYADLHEDDKQRCRTMARAAQDHAALWRQHIGKLDALIAFCPTCSQGCAANAEMTRDEIIFECGKTSGRSEAQAAAPAQAVAVPIDLQGVKEAVEQGSGFWRSCAGCHELNEGHATGPVSKVFGCALGNGCSECGGIGAVWDDLDYGAMADAMAAPAQAPEQWIDDPHDIEQGRMLNPEWVRAQEHPTQLAAQAMPADEFRGDTDSLVRNIVALLDLDAQGCLVPHGVGGHARGLLSAAASRLAAPAQAQEDARDALTLEELDQLDRAIEHFVEGEDTDVDWRLLTRAACLGFLECERFTVPPSARAAIDAARAAQGRATP